MATAHHSQIVRYTELDWLERERLPGWRNRVAPYYMDTENSFFIRLVDQPVGATEPRHVHPGVHGTTILAGRAIIDGVTLHPHDALLGPSNEPHGPLQYPDGCKLLSCFQGSNEHSEAQELSGEKQYRLIQSDQLAWRDVSGGQEKVLLDRGAGGLRLSLLRYAPGTRLEAERADFLQARLVLEGKALVEDQTLGTWDFLCAPAGSKQTAMSFPEGALMLGIGLRPTS